MTTDNTHTPGPWSYRPLRNDDWGLVRGADGMPLMQCSFSKFDEAELGKHRSDGTDPREADARLIAAAPDMLAALKAARDELRSVTQEFMGEDYNSPSLNAAIAKAEGKT